MPTSLLLTIIAGGTTALFLLVLFIERSKHRRYAQPLREFLDQMVISARGVVGRHTPRVPGGVLRIIFHYLAHQVLTIMLYILRLIERAIMRIARFNRTKALIATTSAPDSHLTAIAEHKETTSLSAAEKRKRKNKALRGEL